MTAAPPRFASPHGSARPTRRTPRRRGGQTASSRLRWQRETPTQTAAMAPLTWRVALNDLRKGFKVKGSLQFSPKGKHEFCLDVYRDGWGDEDRDFVQVFVRYVSEEAPAKVWLLYNWRAGRAGRPPRK